jgi:putative flippase GtrA
MSEAELSARDGVEAMDGRRTVTTTWMPRAVRLVHEGGRYLMASVLALGVDYTLLLALTELGRLHYLVSSAISYSVGVGFHYGLCVKFVFRDRPVADRRAEFAGFFAVGLLGLAATQIVLWLCVSQLGVDYRLGKVAATAISFALNFVVRKALLFTARGR